MTSSIVRVSAKMIKLKQGDPRMIVSHIGTFDIREQFSFISIARVEKVCAEEFLHVS